MRRRNFLNKSAMALVSTLAIERIPLLEMGPTSLLEGDGPKGYLIPVGIDSVMTGIFSGIDRNDYGYETENAIREGFNHIFTGDFDVSQEYQFHHDNIVKPQIGKPELAGVGYFGTDKDFSSRLKDENQNPVTAMFSQKDLDHFDRNTWADYCDIADFQITRDDRVYVYPKDGRPEKYKSTVWIPKRFSYLVFNPIYYCNGLPIENPVWNRLDESKKREIKQKTNKEVTVSGYYTQTYLWQGNSCASDQGKLTQIWWDHDDALKEFHDLKSIGACGDPADECIGDTPQTSRPTIPAK